MYVLIKNNRPPTVDCMYWIPPPECGQVQNIPPPYPLLQKHKNPGEVYRGEPGGLWSREFIAFISKMLRKVNTGGLLRDRACFGGPICSSADPLFMAKNHPLNRNNWNAHGVIPTYTVTPGRHRDIETYICFRPLSSTTFLQRIRPLISAPRGWIQAVGEVICVWNNQRPRRTSDALLVRLHRKQIHIWKVSFLPLPRLSK
jgi:hypothetical protein